MVRITVESPSGKRRFAYEFSDLKQAKILLDTLSEEGFEAAEQYVQRLDGSACKICGKPKSYHTSGKHPYRPFATASRAATNQPGGRAEDE